MQFRGYWVNCLPNFLTVYRPDGVVLLCHDRFMMLMKKLFSQPFHDADEKIVLPAYIQTSHTSIPESIADVAVRKRHQRQDENLAALYCNQQNCFSVSNARIYSKRMLCEKHAFVASAQAYAVRTGLR